MSRPRIATTAALAPVCILAAGCFGSRQCEAGNQGQATAICFLEYVSIVPIGAGVLLLAWSDPDDEDFLQSRLAGGALVVAGIAIEVSLEKWDRRAPRARRHLVVAPNGVAMRYRF
jgi:hypothetical protein